MKYYEVPACMDQTENKRVSLLIEHELFTAKECNRYGIDINKLIEREVSKREIYWSFGARFAD